MREEIRSEGNGSFFVFVLVFFLPREGKKQLSSGQETARSPYADIAGPVVESREIQSSIAVVFGIDEVRIRSARCTIIRSVARI